MNYSISELIQIKKDRFEGKMVNCFLVVIAYLLVTGAVTYIFGAISEDGSLRITILESIVQAIVSIFMYNYFLSVAMKDGNVGLVPSMRSFLRGVGAQLLLGIIIMIPVLVAVFVSATSFVFAIMSIQSGTEPSIGPFIFPTIIVLVVFIIVLYLSLTYSLAILGALLDKDDLGVMGSFKLSKRIMKNKRIKFLFLYIFYSLILIVGVILIIVGLSKASVDSMSMESGVMIGSSPFNIFGPILKYALPGMIVSAIGFIVYSLNAFSLNTAVFAECVHDPDIIRDFHLNSVDDIDMENI